MVYSDKREEVHYNRSATVRMKFLNIKIGEVSPIFCIYGDEGRGSAESQRDGAKAVSEAESILMLSSNVMRASAGRRAAGSVKRRSHAARA